MKVLSHGHFYRVNTEFERLIHLHNFTTIPNFLRTFVSLPKPSSTFVFNFGIKRIDSYDLFPL
jgi:hypothetical protein